MRPIFEQARRLVTALTQPRATNPTGLGPATPATSSAGPAPLPVTMEMVQAVLGDGLYQVLGYSLSVSGEAVCQAGQMVPVAWKNNVPAVILEHSARRAQFAPTFTRGEQQFGELLLLKVGKVWDVWLRNNKVFKPLSLSQFINHDGTVAPENETSPSLVRWGVATNTFVVMTKRNVTWTGGSVPSVIALPRFYIFRMVGNVTTPRATLVKTLSTIPTASGVTAFPGSTPPQPGLDGMQPAPGIEGPFDVLLLRDLDVAMLLTVSVDPANPGNVVLVWSAEKNTLLNDLTALNAAFPLPTPPTATTSSTRQFDLRNLAFVSWDKTDKTKQIVLGTVVWKKTVTSNPPPDAATVGTSTTQQGYRAMLWFGSTGGVRDLVPPRVDSFSWSTGLVSSVIVLTSFAGGTQPYSTIDVSVAVDAARVVGPQFLIAVQTDIAPVGHAAIPPTFTFPVSLYSFRFARAWYTGLGGAFIADGTLFPIFTTVSSPPTNVLQYFRFLDAMHLYSIPLSATADPTAPILTQRDMVALLVKNTLGTAPVPVAVFYPPGQLLQDPTLKTAKLLPWSVALPTVQDANNNAVEGVVQVSRLRTDYRLTSA